MSVVLLPSPEAIGDLAGMLVGKKVLATRGAALPPALIRVVALYLDAAGAPKFAALSDVAFVASVGAALAMVPPAVVKEAIRLGKASEGLVENAYEVLNVAASLFNEVEHGALHVKLERKLHLGPPAAELTKVVSHPTARIDLDIKISGYPDGKLAFLALGAR